MVPQSGEAEVCECLVPVQVVGAEREMTNMILVLDICKLAMDLGLCGEATEGNEYEDNDYVMYCVEYK